MILASWALESSLHSFGCLLSRLSRRLFKFLLVAQFKVGSRSVVLFCLFFSRAGFCLQASKTLVKHAMEAITEGSSRANSLRSVERVPLVTADGLESIVAAARSLGPRFDNLTKSMYPPLDDVLLESAAFDLMTASNSVAAACREYLQPRRGNWLEPCLDSVVQRHQALCDQLEQFREYRDALALERWPFSAGSTGSM
eukprot:m.78592 g.78592  ORF g.78592 m.78592 type:complete len:198 (+) comp8166_c0_seq4:385-978(+)